MTWTIGASSMSCVFLPQLAPVEDKTKAVKPQYKAVLYHFSTEVRATTSGILCKPANWKLELHLIDHDVQLLDHQY